MKKFFADVSFVFTSTLAPWVSLVSTIISLLFFTSNLVNGENYRPWLHEYFWTAEWIEGSVFPALLAISISCSVDVRRVFHEKRNSLIASGNLRVRFLRLYTFCVASPLTLVLCGFFVYFSLFWPNLFNKQSFLAYLHFGVSLLTIYTVIALIIMVAMASYPLSVLAGSLFSLILLWHLLDGGGFLVIGSSNGSLLGYQPVLRHIILSVCVSVIVLIIFFYCMARLKDRRYFIFAIIVGFSITLGSASLDIPQREIAYFKDLNCVVEPSGAARTCVSAQHLDLVNSLDGYMVNMHKVTSDVGVRSVTPDTILEHFPATAPGFSVAGSTFDLVVSERVRSFSASSDQLVNPAENITLEDFVQQVVYPVHCESLYGGDLPGVYFRDSLRLASQSLKVLMSEDVTDISSVAREYSSAMTVLNSCKF